jgi:hypothetical protein
MTCGATGSIDYLREVQMDKRYGLNLSATN